MTVSRVILWTTPPAFKWEGRGVDKVGDTSATARSAPAPCPSSS
jgi:hypothetical protein